MSINTDIEGLDFSLVENNESEYEIKSHAQKRGAVLALEALELEMAEPGITLPEILRCHYAMEKLILELERFALECKPKLVEIYIV